MACIFCLRVVARRSNLLLLPSIVVCAVCAEGLAEMCWREALQRVEACRTDLSSDAIVATCAKSEPTVTRLKPL